MIAYIDVSKVQNIKVNESRYITLIVVSESIG